MFKLKKKHYWFDKGFRNCHLWHGESLEITLTVPSIKTFSKNEYNLNNEAHSLKLQFTSISLCHCILNGLPAKTADILSVIFSSISWFSWIFLPSVCRRADHRSQMFSRNQHHGFHELGGALSPILRSCFFNLL